MGLLAGYVVRQAWRWRKEGFFPVGKSLVLLTTAHGEMRGDLGLYGKGSFHELVTRVPTIVKKRPVALSIGEV